MRVLWSLLAKLWWRFSEEREAEKSKNYTESLKEVGFTGGGGGGVWKGGRCASLIEAVPRLGKKSQNLVSWPSSHIWKEISKLGEVDHRVGSKVRNHFEFMVGNGVHINFLKSKLFWK